MIYQPRNVTPTKKSVDIRILDQYFTMEISTNSSVIAYKLFLLDWNNDTRYTGDIEYLDTPLYNGDTLYIEIPHPTLNNYDFISNGNDYKWYVYLYQDETNMLITNGIIQDVEQSIYLTLQQNINILPGMYFKYGEDLIEILNYDPLTGKVTLDEAPTLTPTVGTTYSIYSNFIKTTPEYILYARETPVVTITNPPTTLTTKSYTFNATYSQANDEPIISHRWIIGIPIDGGGGSFEKIYDSGDIYNANLSFTYDAFRNGINYLIELEVTSTYENIGYSGFQYFNVEYQTLEYLEKPMAKLDCNKNAIQIDWVAPTEFSPTLIDNDIYSGNINTILAAKVEGSGTSITLDDTAGDIPMDIDLASSELEQETTTGKQLLDFANGTTMSSTYTFTNDVLNIIGSNNSYTGVKYNFLDIAKAHIGETIRLDFESYTSQQTNLFSIEFFYNDGSNHYLPLIDNNIETKNLIIPNEIANATSCNINIYSNKTNTAQTNTISITKPILHIGTTTTSYEPYTGGIPAPNPSYPMPIHTISGNNTILINNTNIIGLDTNQYKINLKAGDKITAKNNTNATLTIQLFTNYGDTTRNDYWTLSANAQRTITLTADSKAINWQYAPNGIAWINIGDTLLQYEPYTYQEANINLGDIEYCEIGDYKDEFVRSDGSNLFDISTLEIGKAWNNGSNNARAVVFVNCKPNTTYSISTSGISGFDDSKIIVFEKENVASTSQIANHSVTTSTTITTSATTNCLAIQFNKTGISLSDFTNVKIMINLGSTALPYEPYGIGNWGIRKNIGKVVLDGSESGGRAPTSTTGDYRFYVDIGTNIITSTFETIAPFYCDKFKPISRDQSYAKIEGIAPTDSGFNYKSLIIYCEATKNMTFAEFQNWLSSNNVTVCYPYATSIYLPITGTLAEQLEYIYQYLMSYKGQTNIYQINNDLPFVISASAYKYVDIPENSFYIQKNLQNIIPGYNIIISNVLFTISNYNAATGLMTVEENIPYKINMGGDVYTISGVADIPIGSAVTLLRNTPYSGVNSVDTGNYSLIYEDEDSESGLGEYPENYNITLQFKPDASFFYGTEGIFNDINPIAFIESDAPDGVTGMIIIFIHQYNVCAGKPQLSSGVANIQQLGANNTQNVVHLAEDINITNTPYIYFTNYGYVEKVNSYNTTTKMATLNKNLPFALEAGEDYVMLETLTATFYSNPQDAFALQTNRNPQSNLDYRWIDSGNQWEDSKYWVEGGTGIERVAGNWWKLQITNNTIKLEKGGN